MSNKKNIYNLLVDSVDAFSQQRVILQEGIATANSFANFLSHNEKVIGKFGGVTSEMRGFLDNYKFDAGFKFEEIQQKIELLFVLHLKLMEISKIAKKMSEVPKYYNIEKIMEYCQTLLLKCSQKMTLKDVPNTMQQTEICKENFQKVQLKLESDEKNLAQIKEEIYHSKSILVKYKTMYRNLQKYVNKPPYEREDDLKEVQKCIDVTKIIDDLLSIVEKKIGEIKPLCNRHNKNAVENNYMNLVGKIHDELSLNNAEKFKEEIKKLQDSIRKIEMDFEEEKKEIEKIQSSLKKRKPEMWKEDQEEIIEYLERLLKNISTTNFDMNVLKNEITMKKERRNEGIKKMINTYTWLQNKNYCAFHEQLIAKYLSSKEYYEAVQKERNNRMKQICKDVGKVLGVVGLIGLIGAIIFAVIYFIKQIITAIIGIVVVAAVLGVIANSD